MSANEAAACQLGGGAATSEVTRSRAIAKAQRARQGYGEALELLGRSERRRGRDGSVNWMRAQVAVAVRTATPAKDAADEGTVQRSDVEGMISRLADATW